MAARPDRAALAALAAALLLVPAASAHPFANHRRAAAAGFACGTVYQGGSHDRPWKVRVVSGPGRCKTARRVMRNHLSGAHGFVPGWSCYEANPRARRLKQLRPRCRRGDVVVGARFAGKDFPLD